MTIVELIQTVGLGTILIVLIVCIPLIIKGILQFQKINKAWKAEKQHYRDEGAAAKEKEIKLEQRLQAGSNRMDALETSSKQMTQMLQNQEEAINLLIASDKFDIKAYITEQYYYYMPKGYIDADVLDLLESRFQIYEKEGGNGFAAQMMNELRQLPKIRPSDSQQQS